MAYARINWQDLPNTSTPRNATNLNHMEDGIANALTSDNISTTNSSSTSKAYSCSYVNGLTKTAKTTSNTAGYSCTYINNVLVDTYSTSEVKTNKVWIDGKPVYRKVIETNMTNEQKVYTLSSIGLSNYSSIILLRSISQGNPINDDYFTTNTDQLRTLINQSGLIITVGSNFPARPLTIYTIIEYTKTTD